MVVGWYAYHHYMQDRFDDNVRQCTVCVTGSVCMFVYVYIHVCVCVCVCVLLYHCAPFHLHAGMGLCLSLSSDLVFVVQIPGLH